MSSKNYKLIRCENVSLNDIEFGTSIKEEEGFYIPMLTDSEVLLVQLTNLHILNLSNDSKTIVFKNDVMDVNQKSFDFIHELNDKIIDNNNLINIIKKIKDRYLVKDKRYTYESFFDVSEETIEMDVNDKTKFFSFMTPCTYDEFLNQYKVDSNSIKADVIIEPYIFVKNNEIKVQAIMHQIRLKVEKRKNIKLDTYSFIDTDNESCKSDNDYDCSKGYEKSDSDYDSESESECETREKIYCVENSDSD